MEPVESIRRLGFRRWYERQLIECHAWFVTCFIGMILVASALEASNTRDAGFDHALMILLAVAGGGVAILAWTRYKTILARAEEIADHATCPACRHYGSFRVMDSGPRDVPDGADAGTTRDGLWLRVRCRRCEQEWTIR